MVFFTIAVLLATGYGGTIQGLLSTALSLGVVLLFFREHALVLVLATSSLTLFAVLGVAASIILGRLYHTTEVLSQTRDELKDANQKLAEHADALSRSNAELERFAYAVAHDLNAPLRTISARTEFCLERNETKIDRESQESLMRVATSAKRMSHLIESLLTLARVNHSHIGPGAEVQTGKVAELALQHLREEINASGAIIKLEPLPAVRASEDQLLRLFQNLLSNGIKYRSKGPLTIQISAAREGSEWQFVVSDNGIGIDPKYHAKVFEPFHRLHSSSEYEGSGVGLAICKRIVEQHGGRIWLDSAVGKGSRFYFTLPPVAESLPLKQAAQAAKAGTIMERTGA